MNLDVAYKTYKTSFCWFCSQRFQTLDFLGGWTPPMNAQHVSSVSSSTCGSESLVWIREVVDDFAERECGFFWRVTANVLGGTFFLLFDVRVIRFHLSLTAFK